MNKSVGLLVVVGVWALLAGGVGGGVAGYFVGQRRAAEAPQPQNWHAAGEQFGEGVKKSLGMDAASVAQRNKESAERSAAYDAAVKAAVEGRIAEEARKGK